MGSSKSKLPRHRLDVIRDEAKAIFEECYSKQPQENKASLWAPDMRLYIRKINRTECTVIISGHDNHASDIALKAVFDYLSEFVPEKHCYLIASESSIKKCEKKNKSFYRQWIVQPVLPTGVSMK